MRTATITCLLLAASTGIATGADSSSANLDSGFKNSVRPFLQSYCVSCHGGEMPAAQFDLSRYQNTSGVVEDYPHWALVLEKLTARLMPPPPLKQPPDEARRKVIDWVAAVRANEIRKNAGDPGIVLARRLSNAEYNYTIHDLTGADIRPTREFPVDPANPAGFDNSGESLAMSPALLDKYLQAARDVANHMVLRSDGIAFASHLMLAPTDRDRYSVTRIADFYKRQPTDYSGYFQAAWRFKHRAALGKPKATLADIATGGKVSPKYLATVWRALETTSENIGPLAKLQGMWRALPAPKGNQPDLVRGDCDRMRDFVVELRRKIEPNFPLVVVEGIGRVSVDGEHEPIALFESWRNRQEATHRRTFDRAALRVEGETQTPNNDPDLQVPAGQRALYEAAFDRFSALFPDRFYAAGRSSIGQRYANAESRPLSAGYKVLSGFYRDDLPLYELILDDGGRRELDVLWRDLDLVANATVRTNTQFHTSEVPLLGLPRMSNVDITSETVIRQVADGYLAKARNSSNPAAAQAIEAYFTSLNSTFRGLEKARLETEPLHLEGLRKFAARAYRRPLSQKERDDLTSFYRALRQKDGLSHEEAMRDLVVGVLMSPDFCYRIDLVSAGAAKANVRPLPDYSLASRLSYFLWSSMPDEELLRHAAAGDLHRPEVLAAQARRMLKDQRIRRFATEFGGNWLDFRRFEEHNAVDRERFSSFNDQLRQAMFEEPIRLLDDVIRGDRKVLDLLYADYTFVNPVLAKHYGIPKVEGKPSDWVRVDNARLYGRGGLLPMSVFLTKHAPGLRTSPVKRGNWVVSHVLGEIIPPPPPSVPELPRDEAQMELPLRDVLAKHRADPGCAACHSRFDSFGLALEGYGPIGEPRTKDLAGRQVDSRADFPNGEKGEGLEGLKSYIRTHREGDFIRNLCAKTLVYALGRSLMLPDEAIVDEMRAKMAANGNRFSTLVESIVTSPQFRNKRGPDAVKGERNAQTSGKTSP